MNIKDLKKCYLGDKEISKILLGDKVIWEEYKKKWIIDESFVLDKASYEDFYSLFEEGYLKYMGLIIDDNYKIEKYGEMDLEYFKNNFKKNTIGFIFFEEINLLEEKLEQFKTGIGEPFEDFSASMVFFLRNDKDEILQFPRLLHSKLRYE